ncbi:hypothetical protein SLEP1_g31354 [Rubroshorea leprosula]|uniref:Uncharacterized protein n=1 Tax=Rubroshorea leprosula TaxID=152421 RepID=A0AAV5KB71_9ROSI|nr:hypothetical protein SLEP1_g31354 [Rubroshorea leprosula]
MARRRKRACRTENKERERSPALLPYALAPAGLHQPLHRRCTSLRLCPVPLHRPCTSLRPCPVPLYRPCTGPALALQ